MSIGKEGNIQVEQEVQVAEAGRDGSSQVVVWHCAANRH